jgi:cell division transport system permease protein
MKTSSDQIFQDVASRDKPGLVTNAKTYLMRHAQVFFYSLGQLWQAPFSMLMTAAVIGIALALPTGMHVLLANAQQLSGSWDGAAKVSLYLKTGTSEKTATQLASQIRGLKEVAEVEYISSKKGLEEFKSRTGYDAALKALDDNPIPATLLVTPDLQFSTAKQLETLASELGNYKEVDLVQLDSEWVQRLFAIMDIISQGVVILGIMLSIGVLLVVGNTIRLAIQNRRDEIVIVKLIGGTDAFIRRPFLYTGFWYGVFGGLIAIILVFLSLLLISGPVSNLAGLYQSEFVLHKMDFGTIFIILTLSIGLGLGGSWIAVGRHLREIEPR